MKIAIIGAGAWGTALAVSACGHPDARHQVSLWVRDPQQAIALQQQRVNLRYLPAIALPAQLDVRVWPAHGALDAAAQVLTAGRLADQDLIVVATPMAALRELLGALRNCSAPVAWLCKGFEEARADAAAPDARPHGLLAHEVLEQIAPRLHAGVLSGPSFALEVARGQPTALVAASVEAPVRAALVRAFHSPSLRIYTSDDIVGVEVGGAVKNVLAIATGLCDGLRLGLNARAALVTRGLHEMTRLGVALGARAETFMGLSGLGDLVLTATGDLSRNRKVGLALAQGRTLQQAVVSLGHVAEGVYCAHTVVQRARRLAIDMPISAAVEALLDARLSPQQALAALMGREARDESGSQSL
jgi:glycerol-3-phosphate dehydrogenase (NAD(P)+)